MKISKLVLSFAVALSAGVSFTAFADESVKETVKEAVKDTAKDAKLGVKKGARAVQDEVCMGTKVECAAQKAKHKIQNGADKVTK